MLCVTDDDSHYRRQLTRNHERIPVAEHFCMVSSKQTSLYYNTGEAATELDCKIRPARKKTCRSFVNQYIRPRTRRVETYAGRVRPSSSAPVSHLEHARIS